MFKRFSQSIVRFIAAVCLTASCPIAAQENARIDGSLSHLPSLRGDYFLLGSQEVGRDYHIYVRLPRNYDELEDTRFPVVFLLDGDSTFPMLAPLHLFMNYDDQIPEAIIVGIAYGGFDPGVNKRHVDFRVLMDDGSAGGALPFLAMLENELIPQIGARYRTEPTRRIIFGQSRGGSAVLQAAYLKPGLFWGHVASNPGREPDTRLLFGMDREVEAKDKDGYLIVASGSDDRDYLRGTALEWRDTIASRDDLPWDTRFIDIEGGTHAANLGDAYRSAWRIMFSDRPAKASETQP